MKTQSAIILTLIAASALALTACAAVPAPSALSVSPGAESALPARNARDLTARELAAPGALAGPSPSSFNWSPLGALLAYVEPQDGQDMLWLYDAASGEKRLLLDPAGSEGNIDVTSAQWSPDGNRLLLTGDEAFWLLDVATGELTSLAAGGGGSTSVVFTPDGTRVSFVQDNDLYLLDIASGDVQRLTSDGGETVFNGTLDWVYTEELATRAAQPAYAWSPDGVWLIYLRLDESAVNQDPVTDYRPAPATVSYTRYPTVGTPNPTATLHALAQGATAPLPRQDRDVPALELPLPAGAEYVLPFFTWTPDSNHALYITVNRDHTELTLARWTPQSGELRTLIQETASDWINEDRYAAPVFIGDGSQFLWISERDGFMHLYLYTAEGELVRQVTQGNWMIDSSAYNLLTPGHPVHVDPTGSWAYVTTSRTSPLERQIDRVNIASGQIEPVSQQPGFHLAALSADGKYLVDQHSDVATPPITAIVRTDGRSAEVLAQAAQAALDLPQMAREFVTVKAHDGVDLYAQLVKPENFDPAQQYPVVVHWYGGPGLQMVSNRYGSTNIFNIIERDVLYTQEGFLVWRLDNRGSFGRGHGFEAPIFGELGKAALEDQLAGIEYLKTLPYVDATRIGTDGKSFGGYMTLYALLHAPDVFRCGVAGAAPTDWSYYDTIYTERYMRTPDRNPEGYAATNLLAMAGQIEARPLLIHGLADTNVHLQNTVNFIQALEENDKLFNFVPLPNLSHSFRGDGLVAALSASVDYLATCLAGTTAGAAQPAPAMADTSNPASVNCVDQDGMLAIEQRGDGGQFGVCTFGDNRQCEEWALLRGDCPVGGVKVTGYVTPAARYCAITGGTYAITANSGQDDEQGGCTLPDGGQCDAWGYYNGLCDASTAAPAEPASAMGASPAVTATAVSTATMVSLKGAIATMEPQAVWQNFYDLTQVPRPSHHEEQVRAFLVQFGEDLGLETLVDDVGNVLIRKPAAPGLEDQQGVVLQAHMDMVPQKTPESDHDFLADPIDAYVAGEFVVADGTTLGADDGIGMAMAMAVLQEQETPLGLIEALFTVNEEDGLEGALGLEPGWLQGSILINLDSEEEGVFTIGSAGGEYVTIDTAYGEVAVPDGMTAYSVTVSGLQGGHSGVDIAKGRGHATKLLVRLLSPAAQEYGVRLASIAGGDASNAITREATALVLVPEDQADAFLQYVQDFDAIVKSELSIADPGVTAQATPATLPAQIMDETVQRLLLDALYATPQGVLRMSDAVPGLVETSTNIGIVNAAEGKLTASLLLRSSVDTALDDVGQMIASVWDMAGVAVEASGRYSGWRPNPESPIVLLMQDAYREQTGQEAVVSAVHAGLECGTIVSKYPGMDAISIGPTLYDVHTPSERLEIATVPKLMDLLMETLQRIPAQ